METSSTLVSRNFKLKIIIYTLTDDYVQWLVKAGLYYIHVQGQVHKNPLL